LINRPETSVDDSSGLLIRRDGEVVESRSTSAMQDAVAGNTVRFNFVRGARTIHPEQGRAAGEVRAIDGY
jgi:hypothetical protein